MESKDFEKHMRFLHRYACENKILFRVSRSGVSIEDVSMETLELKKKSKVAQQPHDNVEVMRK